MTLDYENFNWFDRPETWTEPCCVIDSWILCKSFYDVYREERYLRLYNRIVTNGLRTFQRQNGGAGCSCCARSGAEEIHSFLYEAYFCCTMRLGEGMRHLFDVKREEKESVVFLLPTSYEDDSLSLSFEPYSSDILAIRSKKPFDLKLYVPRGFSLKGEVGEVKDSFLHLKLEPGEYAFPFVIGRHEENGLHFWGDLLLSKKGEEEEFTPLLDSSLYDEEGLKAIHQRLK